MSSDPAFLTALGGALAIFLSSLGAIFGSIPAGVFALRAGHGWGWKSFIPIVISGVLAIYGLIVAVILCCHPLSEDYPLSEKEGYKNLCAGLAVGSACLASGLGLGKFISIQTPPENKMKVNISDDDLTTTEPLLPRDNEEHPRGNEEHMVSQGDILRTVMVLVFIEAIGLYGLIVALILAN